MSLLSKSFESQNLTYYMPFPTTLLSVEAFVLLAPPSTWSLSDCDDPTDPHSNIQ
jgi:hypothetical protein